MTSAFNAQGNLVKNFGLGSSAAVSAPQSFNAGQEMYNQIKEQKLYDKDKALETLGSQFQTEKEGIIDSIKEKLSNQVMGAGAKYRKSLDKKETLQTSQAAAFKELDTLRDTYGAQEFSHNRGERLKQLSTSSLNKVAKYGKQLLKGEKERTKLAIAYQRKNYEDLWGDYQLRVDALNSFFV